MKTTLNIDDHVMVEMEREAARRGTTMSELAESALRQLLGPPRKRVTLPPLRTFDGGSTRVDISDRDALFDATEGR
jgi:hypothetical protein